MKYSVVFYCPDQHLEYNIHTLDYHGVGGGVTARVRMAHALAAIGHNVTLYVNCPKNETIDHVNYRHYLQLENVKTDIFIASTSGDGLDLSKLCAVDIEAKLNILMSHGIEPPNGVDGLPFDYIYAPSNFARARYEKNWGVDSRKLFVTHHGVRGQNFKQAESLHIQRDPYSLFYAGHPIKGQDAALSVLHLLRQNDPRFTLHIFGGHGLWGDEEVRIGEEPGMIYHGLIGQLELARRMQTISFCINLQAMEDTFGMVNIEAMRAGCIVITSEVGAYPEVVHHGENGFIIKGDHLQKSTHAEAVKIIMELVKDQDRCRCIRENAIASPHDWNTIAKAWEGHWDWALSERPSSFGDFDGSCSLCGGSWLSLADGYHCTHCGYYQQACQDE
jgi:glycosyltransferase involved in cell wall biosynthesis